MQTQGWKFSKLSLAKITDHTSCGQTLAVNESSSKINLYIYLYVGCRCDHGVIVKLSILKSNFTPLNN